MEREQVKKILLYYRQIDDDIRLCKQMLCEYEETCYYNIGGGTMDGLPHGKGSTSNTTEKAALAVNESDRTAMRGLEERAAQLAELKAAIVCEINKLPFSQKSILYDFYISGYQWVRISIKIRYSATQCKKIRNCGLDNLARQFVGIPIIQKFIYTL